MVGLCKLASDHLIALAIQGKRDGKKRAEGQGLKFTETSALEKQDEDEAKMIEKDLWNPDIEPGVSSIKESNRDTRAIRENSDKSLNEKQVVRNIVTLDC